MIDNESGEDYLEAILRLAAKEKDVHAVDVAREIGVSKPAVTKAMRILIRLGVDAKTAETDACRMEHLISDETHAAIRKFMES